MKGKVPSRIPWVFPLVRHRDDVAVEHVEPLGIASVPLRPDHRMRLMLDEPAVQIKVVVLFAPQHSCHCLTMYATFVLAEVMGSDAVIKFVSIRQTSCE